MSAHALIEEARADGLELQPNGDRLKLRGPAEVVERWKPRIVASKSEILAALHPAPRSTWWLVHFLDGAPGEVRTQAPATHTEILERHPEAIAAEPFAEHSPNEHRTHVEQACPSTPTSCDTCAHVTGRGACGEPVAAGLSAKEGVISYHGTNGKDCLAWLATIPADHEKHWSDFD